MEALIVIGVLYALFVGIPDLFSWLKTRDAKARRQLRAYEEWLEETYALAIEAQDVDAFAQLTAVRVRNFHKSQRPISK
jgi:hypothetical protein